MSTPAIDDDDEALNEAEAGASEKTRWVGCPLFPACKKGEKGIRGKRWKYITKDMEPGYIRVTMVTAGLSRASPKHYTWQTFSLDNMKRRWGDGEFLVELIADADSDNKRIFQRTVKIAEGLPSKPFPGPDDPPDDSAEEPPPPATRGASGEEEEEESDEDREEREREEEEEREREAEEARRSAGGARSAGRGDVRGPHELPRGEASRGRDPWRDEPRGDVAGRGVDARSGGRGDERAFQEARPRGGDPWRDDPRRERHSRDDVGRGDERDYRSRDDVGRGDERDYRSRDDVGRGDERGYRSRDDVGRGDERGYYRSRGDERDYRSRGDVGRGDERGYRDRWQDEPRRRTSRDDEDTRGDSVAVALKVATGLVAALGPLIPFGMKYLDKREADERHQREIELKRLETENTIRIENTRALAAREDQMRTEAARERAELARQTAEAHNANFTNMMTLVAKGERNQKDIGAAMARVLEEGRGGSNSEILLKIEEVERRISRNVPAGPVDPFTQVVAQMEVMERMRRFFNGDAPPARGGGGEAAAERRKGLDVQALLEKLLEHAGPEAIGGLMDLAKTLAARFPNLDLSAFMGGGGGGGGGGAEEDPNHVYEPEVS